MVRAIQAAHAEEKVLMKPRSRSMMSAVGERSGMIEVIGDLFTIHKRKRRVLCECSCGRVRVMQLNNIRSSNSRSCGCKKFGYPSYKTPYGHAAAKTLYGNYKRGALQRNYCFELSFETFMHITSSTCFHCGALPSQLINLIHSKGKHAGKQRVNGSYTYNGIDRLDNAMGYTLENSVPSCSICNVMKWTLSVDEFHQHIRKIYQRLFSNETTLPFP